GGEGWRSFSLSVGLRRPVAGTLVVMIFGGVAFGASANTGAHFRRPQRCFKTSLDEFAGVARAGVEPVRYVFFVCQAGQPDDADGLCRAVKRVRGLGGLLAAGFVVVLQDDHVPASYRP